MSNEDRWYQEGKEYLNIELKGIELLKDNLVNFDKLYQSDLFHHELAYTIIKELGDRVKDISLMAFDENNNELYILVGNEQYKFSLQEDGLYLNDLMVNTRSVYIPEFDEEKIFIKE